MFFKIVNNLTPLYSKEPIPLLHRSYYSLHNQDVIGRIGARTEKFQSSFYPHCLAEWNELDPELRHASSVAVFKKKLLSIIRPPAKSVFGIYDPVGFSYLTQNQSWSKQIKPHKFLHNFRDTVNPMWSTFCCFAFHLKFNDEIFSKEFRNYYDHLSKSTPFQTTL